jgi:hypothetical protein
LRKQLRKQFFSTGLCFFFFWGLEIVKQIL